MLNRKQLREVVIRPALVEINAYSNEAEELLFGICAVESLGGTYLKQVNGPALGIYQMEPRTYNDLYHNYLKFRPEKLKKILKVNQYSCYPKPISLIYNLKFATQIARTQLLRFESPIPNYKDVEGLARYWKNFWNTYRGKGNVEDFIDRYNRFNRWRQ